MVADAATMPEDDQSTTEGSLDETAWLTLVDSVNAGRCTPFLGAGVAWPHLPTGKELSTALAEDYGYPMEDQANLPRVAQYVAILHDAPFTKRQVYSRIKARRDEFTRRSGDRFPDNYRILANLDVPLYLTTNYDDFLTRALNAAGRNPDEVVCRWNGQLYEDLGSYPQISPTVPRPAVFHMHGHLSNEDSLLVTEDDYIDFTVSLGQQSEAPPVIPLWVRRALARTTLLFVGYSLEDFNFRVLMRQLIKQQDIRRSQQAQSFSIQLSDTDIPLERRLKAERFLADYLGTSAIRIYWGKAAPFLEELDRRCRAAREASRGSND